MTVEQLRLSVTTAAAKYEDDPTITVVVKQINSRKVYIEGAIAKAGSYPLTEHMTVTQLIAVAGGVQDFADEEHIAILRADQGHFTTFNVNYKDLKKRKSLNQNVELKSGDTIIVP